MSYLLCFHTVVAIMPCRGSSLHGICDLQMCSADKLSWVEQLEVLFSFWLLQFDLQHTLSSLKRRKVSCFTRSIACSCLCCCCRYQDIDNYCTASCVCCILSTACGICLSHSSSLLRQSSLCENKKIYNKLASHVYTHTHTHTRTPQCRLCINSFSRRWRRQRWRRHQMNECAVCVPAQCPLSFVRCPLSCVLCSLCALLNVWVPRE